MHQDEKPLFYVVNIITFENVLDVIQLNDGTTKTNCKLFVGIIATFIRYDLPGVDENVKTLAFNTNSSLGQYIEIFSIKDGEALDEILNYDNVLVIDGLKIKYCAPSFIEALDNLGIAH